MLVRMQKSGAVTIPKAIREQLGLKPGSSRINFSSDGRNMLFVKAVEKCAFCGETRFDKLVKIGNGAICNSCLMIANDRKMKVIDGDIKKSYEIADKASDLIRESNRFKTELNILKNQLKQELTPIMLTYPCWDIVKIYGMEGVIEARTFLNLKEEEIDILIDRKEIKNFKSGIIKILLRELVLGRYCFPEENEPIETINYLYDLKRLDISPEEEIHKKLYNKNICNNLQKNKMTGYYLKQLFKKEEEIHRVALYLSDRVFIGVLLNDQEWFQIVR